jgi:hypothetical protein
VLRGTVLQVVFFHCFVFVPPLLVNSAHVVFGMSDPPPTPEGIDFFAEFRHELDYGGVFDFGLFFGADFAAMFSFDDDSSSHHSFGLYSYDDVSISFSDEGRRACCPSRRQCRGT